MYDLFDVVRIPFPYADAPLQKVRPAVILSSCEAFGRYTGQSLMAMVTSAHNSHFPLDTKLRYPEKAGLAPHSMVRMKIFTLDHKLILRREGSLHGSDKERVADALRKLMPFL